MSDEPGGDAAAFDAIINHEFTSPPSVVRTTFDKTVRDVFVVRDPRMVMEREKRGKPLDEPEDPNDKSQWREIDGVVLSAERQTLLDIPPREFLDDVGKMSSPADVARWLSVGIHRAQGGGGIPALYNELSEAGKEPRVGLFSLAEGDPRYEHSDEYVDTILRDVLHPEMRTARHAFHDGKLVDNMEQWHVLTEYSGTEIKMGEGIRVRDELRGEHFMDGVETATPDNVNIPKSESITEVGEWHVYPMGEQSIGVIKGTRADGKHSVEVTLQNRLAPRAQDIRDMSFGH